MNEKQKNIVTINIASKSITVTSNGIPMILGDGWKLISISHCFFPFVILNLRNESISNNAVWILSQNGELLSNSIENLSGDCLIEFVGVARRQLIDILHPILECKIYDSEYLNNDFFKIDGHFRASILKLVGVGLHGEIELCNLELKKGAWDIDDISPDHLKELISVDLQAAYISACKNGALSLTSVFGENKISDLHVFCISNLLTIIRCFDSNKNEIFYYICLGFDQKISGIYMPSRKLYFYLQRKDLTDYRMSITDVLDAYCHHLIDHINEIFGFLNNKQKTVSHYLWQSGASHMGHYLWNELSGIERMVVGLKEDELPIVYDLSGAAKSSFYGDLGDLYPELRKVISHQFYSLHSLVKHSYKHNVSLIRFSGSYVSQKVRDRIGNLIASSSSGDLSLLAFTIKTTPVIVFGLRVENRTLVNQSEFYINLAKKISAIVGPITVIVDGHNSKNNSNGVMHSSHLEHRASKSLINAEREILDSIKLGLAGSSVIVYDCLGYSVLDNLAWLSNADYAIAPWGAGFAKYRWVLNLPMYALSSKFNLASKADMNIYSDSEFMESPADFCFNSSSIVEDFPDAPSLIEVDPPQKPFFINYRVDVDSVAEHVIEYLHANGVI